jgi:hypothetical protein
MLVLMSPATAERCASSAGSLPKYAILPSVSSLAAIGLHAINHEMIPLRVHGHVSFF